MNYIICLGHLLGTCKKCKADDWNKQCPHYRPVHLFLVEVSDEDTDKRFNSSKSDVHIEDLLGVRR